MKNFLCVLKKLKSSLLIITTIFSLSFFSFPLQAQTPQPTQTPSIKEQSPELTQQPDKLEPLPPISEKLQQERFNALPELKIKLEQVQKRNRADLFLIFNERFFTNLLAELTKTKFNAGNLFDVTVVNSKMVLLNGIALAQLQTKLISTNTLLNVTLFLNITAKLSIEQDENSALIAKFQLIDIQPTKTETNPTPTVVTADQLGKLLPPVTLPLELDFDRTFQPDKFSQTKPIAYEVTTESRRISGRFKIIDLLPLNGRLVLLAKVQNLSITQGQGRKRNKPPAPKLSPVSFLVQQQTEPKTNLLSTNELDKQVDELSATLTSKTDFSVIIKRYFLDLLADQFAQSSTRDLIIKLMPCRVMSSKSDLGFAKYENYLDIENGDGTVDLKDAEVQSLRNGQINLFIDAVGQIQAQAKGKQIGFEYDANPQIGVSLRDQVAFTFEQVGQDFQIKPVPKKISVHLDIRVPVKMIGQDINTSQNVMVDTTTVIKPITLPKVINTNLALPQGTQTITLSDVNYKLENDQLFFGANLTFSAPKQPTETKSE